MSNNVLSSSKLVFLYGTQFHCNLAQDELMLSSLLTSIILRTITFIFFTEYLCVFVKIHFLSKVLENILKELIVEHLQIVVVQTLSLQVGSRYTAQVLCAWKRSGPCLAQISLRLRRQDAFQTLDHSGRVHPNLRKKFALRSGGFLTPNMLTLASLPPVLLRSSFPELSST